MRNEEKEKTFEMFAKLQAQFAAEEQARRQAEAEYRAAGAEPLGWWGLNVPPSGPNPYRSSESAIEARRRQAELEAYARALGLGSVTPPSAQAQTAPTSADADFLRSLGIEP